MKQYNLVAIYRGECCAHQHIWCELVEGKTSKQAVAKLRQQLEAERLDIEMILEVPAGDVHLRFGQCSVV